jgi:hypothetical protein
MLKPSPRMRALADRRNLDAIFVFTETVTTDVGTNLRPSRTETAVYAGPALVRQQAATLDQSGQGRTTSTGDLTVKISATNGAVIAGQKCRVTACDDPQLVGRVGTVTDVEHDSLRAVRRFTIRQVPTA